MELSKDISRIARQLADDPHSRDDLQQEMRCTLLTLPAGKSRSFYLRALTNRAFNYWSRCLLDTPRDHANRPIIERRTRCIGGLHELDAVSHNHAA